MDMPNGLNISFSIQLSPEELSALPYDTLERLAEVARQVCLAQAKPLLEELRRSMEVHKKEIASLEALGKQMQELRELPDRADLIDGCVIKDASR